MPSPLFHCRLQASGGPLIVLGGVRDVQKDLLEDGKRNLQGGFDAPGCGLNVVGVEPIGEVDADGQIAGRLKLEALHPSVEPMEGSIPTGGARISHEALYTWIYALPKGELARLGVMLPSKRGARRPHRKNGLWGARVVGMRSIRERPE